MAFKYEEECPYCHAKPTLDKKIMDEGRHFPICGKCQRPYEVNINFEFAGMDVSPLKE